MKTFVALSNTEGFQMIASLQQDGKTTKWGGQTERQNKYNYFKELRKQYFLSKNFVQNHIEGFDLDIE